ncbi:redox-regulated ATPase YchF [bacterium]|nr:redox-regulated ATPase YchF [bacterium]
MSLSLGIVGLPNVGKSTLFNALTKSDILAANYPFATIEPNVGIVPLPDRRLDELARVAQAAKVVPAPVTFTDIAGIVKGAAEGAGLGNKFLSHIRECAAIVQVVRAFENDDIIHVDDKIDPARDIDTIKTELILADLATLDRAIPRLEKDAKTSAEAKAAVQTLADVRAKLDAGELAVTQFHNVELPEAVRELQLLTAKPFIYVFNVDEAGLSDVALHEKLRSLVAPLPALVLCAELEAQLKDMSHEEASELLGEYGQKESGLEALAHLGFSILGLQTYFTAGEKEAKAWVIPQGATAPEAAGVIHTDFEKGFIKAEIASYEDFVQLGGWSGARSAGKVRLEGRDYVMQDGDVVLFRFNN